MGLLLDLGVGTLRLGSLGERPKSIQVDSPGKILNTFTCRVLRENPFVKPSPLASKTQTKTSSVMADAGTIRTFEDFLKVHGLLLAAAGIPQSLYRKLFEKLSTETFDGGNYFQVEPVEDGRQRRLVLTTSNSMGKESNIFLVDHALSFRLADAPKQVKLLPVQSSIILSCSSSD